MTHLTHRVRQVLSASNSSSARFTFLALNSTHMLSFKAAPGSSLQLWSYMKAKLVATVDLTEPQATTIRHCSLSPLEGSAACVSGDAILQCWQTSEADLAPLSMPSFAEGAALTVEAVRPQSHSWLSAIRLVVGTKVGQLLVQEPGSSFSQTLTTPSGDDVGIGAIVSYARGFICGAEYAVAVVNARPALDACLTP